MCAYSYACVCVCVCVRFVKNAENGKNEFDGFTDMAMAMAMALTTIAKYKYKCTLGCWELL